MLQLNEMDQVEDTSVVVLYNEKLYGPIVSPLTQEPPSNVVKSGVVRLESNKRRGRTCEFDVEQDLYKLKRRSKFPFHLPGKGEIGDKFRYQGHSHGRGRGHA